MVPVQMATYRCDSCRGKDLYKYTSLYWRFRRPTGFSIGYLERLCLLCVSNHVRPLIRGMALERDQDDAEHCDSCHTQTLPTTESYVYLRAYPPGAELEQYDLYLCDTCTSMLQNRVMTHGKRLPDRNDELLAAQEVVRAAWEPLGVQPRA